MFESEFLSYYVCECDVSGITLPLIGAYNHGCTLRQHHSPPLHHPSMLLTSNKDEFILEFGVLASRYTDGQ